MPDSSSVLRRVRAFKLSDAQRKGQIIRLYCSMRRRTRRYFPTDMITLVGDRTIYDMADGIRCQDCKKQGYMTLRCESIVGSDIGKMSVRRLVEVKVRRFAVWSDDVL